MRRFLQDPRPRNNTKNVPAFLVHKNGTGQTLTHDANTTATWSTVTIDNFSGFASNAYTIPEDGFYYLYTQGHLTAALDDAAAYLQIELHVGGSAVSTGVIQGDAASANYVATVSASRLVNLSLR